MKKLIKFNATFNDEFDVYGFSIMTGAEWYSMLSTLPEDLCTEWLFGSNYSAYFESLADFMRCFNVLEISDTTADTIMDAFGLNEKYSTWGYFPESLFEKYRK